MEPGGGIEPPPDPYQGPVLPLNYPGLNSRLPATAGCFAT